MGTDAWPQPPHLNMGLGSENMFSSIGNLNLNNVADNSKHPHLLSHKGRYSPHDMLDGKENTQNEGWFLIILLL